MRIEAIDCLHADGGNTVFDFVRIRTDDGLTGWSEYNEHFSGIGVTAAINALADHLIGSDPRVIEYQLQRMRAMRRVVPGGMAAQAIAALENALWDIRGKLLGVPVYALFGGPVRERIPLYWSHLGFYRALFHESLQLAPLTTLDELRDAAARAVAEGYRAVKTNLLIFDDTGVRSNNPGFARGDSFPELHAEHRYRQSLQAQLAAVREGCGPEADIMVDLNFNYRQEGCIAMAHAAESFNPAWLEIDTPAPEVLADIRRRTRIPVASGESLFGRGQYGAFFRQQAIDVPIIDVLWNGLSESLKIASLAEMHELNVAPHNFCGPLATLMSAHFCALTPNLRIMEYDPEHVPWYEELLTRPLTIGAGELQLSAAPGWGADIDETVLSAHPPVRPDA